MDKMKMYTKRFKATGNAVFEFKILDARICYI
jgi:hypothetical protein